MMNDYDSLEFFNWKSAQWKLRLPTDLPPPTWDKFQYLTIEKSQKYGHYSAEIWVHGRKKKLTHLKKTKDIELFLKVEDVLDNILPFDIDNLNNNIRLVVNERTQRAKHTRLKNLDDFCENIHIRFLSKIIGKSIKDYDNDAGEIFLGSSEIIKWLAREEKASAYDVLNELKLLDKLNAKEVACKASFYCNTFEGCNSKPDGFSDEDIELVHLLYKDSKGGVECRKKDSNDRWGTNYYPYVILRLIIEELMSDVKYEYYE